MDTPAPAAPKFLLLFLLLSILLLIVCSPGVFFSTAKDIEQQHQLQTEDQIFLLSRRKLLRNTTMHVLLNFLTSNSPALNTIPSMITAVAQPIWCVAKKGWLPKSLQEALDYACRNGANCWAIQQLGSCYYPDTVQNHASYAFNSYYITNPNKTTSCDFGGAAVLTSVDPSNGTCIYPSSSSSTTLPPTTPTPTTAPSSTTVPPTTTTPTPKTAASSGSTPPPSNSGLGGSTTGFGGIPPTTSPSPISMSSDLQQTFIGCIIVVTSFITWVIVLDI